MKYLALMVAILLPVGASAEEPRTPVEASRIRLGPDWLSRGILLAPAWRDQAPASAQPRQEPPPPPPPRRRGSMVGYIADAVVDSKVRARFDAAFHNTAPDRAEFFYAKCGCYRDLPSTSPAFDPNAPGPGPGVLWDLNYQQFRLEAEFAVHERVSLLGELPFRWIQPQAFDPTAGSFPDASGLSDVAFGAKAALVSTDQSVLSVQLRFSAPSGNASKGLGTDHWTIEPALLYYQSLSDRVALEAQFGNSHPTSGSAGVPTSSSDKFSGDVIFYGIGPSVEVYRSGTFSFAPVIELAGWHVVNGFQTAATSDAGGIDIVHMKFGARTSFGRGNSLYVGYGHALTDDDWYDDIVRIEYRYRF